MRAVSTPCAARWTRPPFIREQFDALGRVTPGMRQAEIVRRVRATSFGVLQPIVELHGFVFQHKPTRGG